MCWTAKVEVLFGLCMLCALVLVSSLPAQEPTDWNPLGSEPPGPLPAWLLNKAGQDVPHDVPDQPLFGESLTVEIHAEALGTANQLQVSLDDRTDVVVVRDSLQPMEGGFVWVGHIRGQPGSSAIFSVVGDGFAGKITTKRNKAYLIEPITAGLAWMIEIVPQHDERLSHLQIPSDSIILDSLPQPCGGTDAPMFIDALVVYTNAARDPTGMGMKTTSEMEAYIHLIETETNLAFQNSGVHPRLRVVHTEEVSYVEGGGDPQIDLTALETHGDGQLDNIQILRNTSDADVVFLLIKSAAGFSGQSNQLKALSLDFAPNAFAVVVSLNAWIDYALSHELGHLMGAAHKCGEAGDIGVADYSHAFSREASGIEEGGWRTIMAEEPDFPRINYFSNPHRDEPSSGLAMGQMTVDCQTDNHRALNRAALTVANFRCGAPSADDVWMRDSWNDTGLEPDPATAGDLMWDSPYIWVRRNQDPNFEHELEHEGPINGAPNWIYVKLHNGFHNATDGDLRVFWSPAGTASNWPIGWNPLPAVPVTGFPARSTRIVEVRWDVPPGPGLYCLAAHWDSAADPTPLLATPGMEVNVRMSNNLVWRNLSIVQLPTIIDSDIARFEVIPPPLAAFSFPPSTTSIRIRPSGADAPRSFIDAGEVIVRLDDRLMNAWELGGSHGEGFELIDEGLKLVDPNGASLRDFRFITPQPAHMTIKFSRRLKTAPGTYRIDVEQSFRDGGGGLSFEIRVPTHFF